MSPTPIAALTLVLQPAALDNLDPSQRAVSGEEVRSPFELIGARCQAQGGMI